MGQGAFFFWCILAINPTEMWYDTPYMKSMSKENFGRTREGFFVLYIRMNVSDGEAYESAILISASIIAFDM